MSPRLQNEHLREYVGSPDGRFEDDSRIYVEEVKTIAEVALTGAATGGTRIVPVVVTKPDPRLILRVTVGFQPVGVDPNSVNLIGAGSWWLSALGDIGGELRPAEDLEGTEANLVPIIQNAGHFCRVIEVDSNYSGVRMGLSLRSPNVAGLWRLHCAWCAKYPMSERDWRLARAACRSEFMKPVAIDVVNP